MESLSNNVFGGVNGNEGGTSRDLELVAAARAGSNAAFEELESRHSRRLYRRIQSITKNHEDAEDALQETFLQAYLALNSFEGRSQFSTWLTRIAINSALMVLRKRHRRAEVPLEQSPDSGEPSLRVDLQKPTLNPEQVYDLHERSYCVARAIGKLNAKHRAPMATWIEQECSIQEVARILGISLAAVKSRLCRARKELASTGRSGSAFRVPVQNLDRSANV